MRSPKRTGGASHILLPRECCGRTPLRRRARWNTVRSPHPDAAPRCEKRAPRLRGSVATCPTPARPDTQDELDHAKEWWPEVASSFFVKRRASNFESPPHDCGGNRSLPKIRTQRSSIRLQYGDSLRFRIEYYCFVKKRRLLPAALEDPIFAVPPVFLELMASKMDVRRLTRAITMSMEEPRDWARCVIPDNCPILQGCSILHLVAGQPPKSGFEPDNYEVFLDVICTEVLFFKR